MVVDRIGGANRRVCIDGRLGASAATGVASYAMALREALATIGVRPLTLDDDARGRFGVRSGAAGVVRRRLRALSPAPVMLRAEGDRLHARDVFRLAQARFAMTGRLLRLHAPGPRGIMHWTYPIPARIEGWINLYTVHDVIPLLAPEFSPIDPVGLRRRLIAVARQADRIVAVSAAARLSIVETLGLDSARVTDCGAAVAALAPGGGALPAGLEAGGYFLFCGLDEPRKNLPRIIAAWQASGARRPLVLAGPDMTNVAPHDRLIVLPYQPRPALIDLVANARALLFPTLAEGFGLPVAEAMTLGTAVLTADRGALAETAGGAALGIDPADGAAIANAVTQLDRDDALCVDLAARGRVRARAFTPAAFGARLARLHDEFAGTAASVR